MKIVRFITWNVSVICLFCASCADSHNNNISQDASQILSSSNFQEYQNNLIHIFDRVNEYLLDLSEEEIDILISLYTESLVNSGVSKELESYVRQILGGEYDLIDMDWQDAGLQKNALISKYGLLSMHEADLYTINHSIATQIFSDEVDLSFDLIKTRSEVGCREICANRRAEARSDANFEFACLTGAMIAATCLSMGFTFWGSIAEIAAAAAIRDRKYQRAEEEYQRCIANC